MGFDQVKAGITSGDIDAQTRALSGVMLAGEP